MRSLRDDEAQAKTSERRLSGVIQKKTTDETEGFQGNSATEAVGVAGRQG
jgi:hypothetical protein